MQVIVGDQIELAANVKSDRRILYFRVLDYIVVRAFGNENVGDS